MGLTTPGQTLTVNFGTKATTFTVTDGDGRSRTFTGNAGLLVGATDANGDTLTITHVGTTETNQREIREGATVSTVGGGNSGDNFSIFRTGTWQYRPRQRL